MKKLVVAVFALVFSAQSAAFLNLNLGGPKKPADPLTVDNEAPLKGLSEVAIGSFKVSYVVFDKSSSTSTAPMFSSDSGFAKMTLRARLAGVDDATFQALTDFAYRDTVEKLAAAGIKVVPRARIENTAAYAKLPTTPNPHKETSSFTAVTGGSREAATFAPTGLPLYHESEFGAGPRAVPSGIYAVADEAGVPTLNVHYLVHFAFFTGEASTLGDTKTARVTMGQTVRTEHGSQWILSKGYGGTFNNPNTNIMLTWGEASDRPYGDTSEATSDAQTAANAFSSVVGLFSGGSMSAKEYLITADPGEYSLAAREVLQKTTAKFADKVASLR